MRNFLFISTAVLFFFINSFASAESLTFFGFTMGCTVDDFRKEAVSRKLSVLEEKHVKEHSLLTISTSGDGYDGNSIYRVDFVFDENTSKLENIIVRQDAHTFDDTSKILRSKYGTMGKALSDNIYLVKPYAIGMHADYDPQYKKSCVYVSYATEDFLKRIAEGPSKIDNKGY